MPINTIYNKLNNLRNRHFFIIDLLITLLTPAFSLILRFDGNITIANFIPEIVYYTVIFSIIKLLIFYYFGLYNRIWSTASIDDLARLIFIGINVVLLSLFAFGVLINFSFRGF